MSSWEPNLLPTVPRPPDPNAPLEERFSGLILTYAPSCDMGTDLPRLPCSDFTLSPDARTQLNAQLEWTSPVFDLVNLDLYLLKDGRPLARSAAISSGVERLTTTLTAGQRYQIRVVLARGATSQSFSVIVRRTASR